MSEYLTIADEVASRVLGGRAVDGRRHPRAAETVRSFLMVRLRLHLGLRQKNLRQLLVRPREDPLTSERELERLKRGELRWSVRGAGWEVSIPCAPFKKAHSAYFSRRPFRLVLQSGRSVPMDPCLPEGSSHTIARRVRDPGTFFVKTVKSNSRPFGTVAS